MTGELRIEYPGAIYHVLNRGDQRDDIVRGGDDRHRFIATLEEACAKTDWQVHAYWDGSGNGSLRTVCDCVHRNPVRARLLKVDQPLEAFGWSSYGCYLHAGDRRPGWLRVDRLLGEKRIPKGTEAGRRQFALEKERRRAQETGAESQEHLALV